MSTVAMNGSDPILTLREQAERIIARGDLKAGERHALLLNVRDRLTEALGVVNEYIGDEQNAQVGEQILKWEDEQLLRLNASIFEEVVKRGIATAEQLHDAGMFSHDELDALEESGRLDEAWDWAQSALHPRERVTERFTDKFGSVLDRLKGDGVKGRGGKKTKPAVKAKPKPAAAKPKTPATPKAPAAATPATAADGGDWNAKRVAMEKRVSDYLAGNARAALTNAESHFNDAGKVSQRTLARYVEMAATRPQTIDLYSKTDSDGGRIWDDSRRQLHEHIIDRFMRQRVWDDTADGGKGGWALSGDAPQFQSSDDPQVLFSGGGYAAGKSSVLKINRAKGLEPDSGYDGPLMVLDPDAIKAELPEFQELLGTDPEANMHVYQEAWAISQEIQARAAEKKINMIVDGISNTSPEEMMERARSFTDRGYTAKAIYVDIPTEEALRRAASRAQNATSDSDKRHIPEPIMRAVHRDVAATVPNLLRRLASENVPLEVEVWDNDQGKDDAGHFNPPKRFMHYVPEGFGGNAPDAPPAPEPGAPPDPNAPDPNADPNADPVSGPGENVEDQPLWDRFVAKAHETITTVGLDTPNL